MSEVGRKGSCIAAALLMLWASSLNVSTAFGPADSTSAYAPWIQTGPDDLTSDNASKVENTAYDGEAFLRPVWEDFSTSNGPRSMAGHSPIYDTLNKEVSVFGRYREAILGDELTALPCAIPDSDIFTTMLEYQGYLYIGSANPSNHAYIYRYDPVADVCIKWQDARVYFVYSSGKYGGVAFWGNRGRKGLATGPLLYFNGTTFGTIPGNVWFSSTGASGWIEDFHVFNNRLYASGTIMKGLPESSNNFFVKYCDNAPCLSSSDWHWTDVSPGNIGYLDDGAELEEFKGDLYLATYDPASVLKYDTSTNTWWHVLSGALDGNTPGFRGGYGIFGLANYSGYLHAISYRYGWHWKSEDGISWSGVNLSYEIMTRAFLFENRMYAGGTDASGYYIIAYDGTSWSEFAYGSTYFRYFAMCEDRMCTTSGNQVLQTKGVVQTRPSRALRVTLSGSELEDVTINWDLSFDDGMGSKSVTGYKIFRSETYDPGGLGYQLMAFLPNGTSEFIDILAGEGNPDSYFYRVCSVDVNNTTCAKNQGAKFTRPLSEGPNLVSIPLIQSKDSIGEVLKTLKFDKAWTYDSPATEWETYMTFKPYGGELKTINHTKGIWVNVTGNCNLTVAGLVPQNTSIHLGAGWNLVGFPSFNSTYTVSDLKAAVNSDRVEGFDPSSIPYHLSMPADTEVLQAGYGYWINVPADIDWVLS
jgi:hypothetical protein